MEEPAAVPATVGAAGVNPAISACNSGRSSIVNGDQLQRQLG